jgi:ribosome biogenesis GTPase / thiamine phosphate phosphatase
MDYSALHPLGWSQFFFQQLSFDEICVEDTVNQLLRITAIHRNRVQAHGVQGERSVLCPAQFQPTSQHLAVGDWIMAEPANEHHRLVKILEPKNRVQRVSGGMPQAIAANLDYLWIVTSANDEFNIKRLERYLALACDFDITPVVLLTKVDICLDLPSFTDKLSQLGATTVHPISVHLPATLECLSVYLHEGSSIALVGSSGVGKSTLINHLFRTDLATQEIRQTDSHGRHTTTHRELFFCDSGAAIIDTPGMRELQLLDAEQGLERVFHSIAELSAQCKYPDCGHQNEPGCAIQDAIAQGDISQSHFDNYLKLRKENASQQRRTQGAHAVKQHYRDYFKKIHSSNKEQW